MPAGDHACSHPLEIDVDTAHLARADGLRRAWGPIAASMVAAVLAFGWLRWQAA
jgi:hypothetical protein